MSSLLGLLVAWICVVSLSSSDVQQLPSMFGGRIKHVIAIMFENRSFDHFLGHLITSNEKVDGCTPKLEYCKNPMNPEDRKTKYVPVGFEPAYIQPGGPCHNITGTTYQLYAQTNADIHTYPAPMNGFIKNYAERDTIKHDKGAFIMQCFNETSLPIMSTLAQQFGMFNAWFSDVPGPTEPNRLYSWMATSQGLGNDAHEPLIEGFIGDNIFKMLDDYWNYTNISSNQKWRLYFETFPTAIFVEYTRFHPENARFMIDFFEDLKTGDLPLYSWLDPNYFEMEHFPRNDQHPDANVLEGEKLMKKIYENVRASPVWNETLLLIFYDEHGGFFDHVSPPFAPNPDGINVTEYGPPFDFERLGLRVPAVLISPWIVNGTVVPAAIQNEFYNASQYTTSSLIHTLREQFTPNAHAFTKRDAWSKTFEDVVMQLNEPRTDCPMKLPDVPIYIENRDNGGDDGDCMPTDFQIALMKSVSTLCGKENEIDQLLTQGSDVYGPIMMDCVREWQSGKYIYGD